MLEISFGELETLAGQELPPSEWFLIDQNRVDKFADATGDHQWIHVDTEKAGKMLGGTIAHGYLTLSLLPMLGQQTLKVTNVASALNYGSERIRFTNLTPVGSRVRLKQTCLEVSPKSGGKLVKIEAVIEIEGKDKPAIIAQTLTLFFG